MRCVRGAATACSSAVRCGAVQLLCSVQCAAFGAQRQPCCVLCIEVQCSVQCAVCSVRGALQRVVRCALSCSVACSVLCAGVGPPRRQSCCVPCALPCSAACCAVNGGPDLQGGSRGGYPGGCASRRSPARGGPGATRTGGGSKEEGREEGGVDQGRETEHGARRVSREACLKREPSLKRGPMIPA